MMNILLSEFSYSIATMAGKEVNEQVVLNEVYAASLNLPAATEYRTLILRIRPESGSIPENIRVYCFEKTGAETNPGSYFSFVFNVNKELAGASIISDIDLATELDETTFPLRKPYLIDRIGLCDESAASQTGSMRVSVMARQQHPG